jgi:CBS domain containing-hemolysin-like protein
MEDLLEEIVGDIYDEYDRQERKPSPAEGPVAVGIVAAQRVQRRV